MDKPYHYYLVYVGWLVRHYPHKDILGPHNSTQVLELIFVVTQIVETKGFSLEESVRTVLSCYSTPAYSS